jgi:hypothetical protein
MASSHRTNRYIAPSLRGERSIDAAEQHARERILRETFNDSAEKTANSAHLKTNPRDCRSPLITYKLKTQP